MSAQISTSYWDTEQCWDTVLMDSAPLYLASRVNRWQDDIVVSVGRFHTRPSQRLSAGLAVHRAPPFSPQDSRSTPSVWAVDYNPTAGPVVGQRWRQWRFVPSLAFSRGNWSIIVVRGLVRRMMDQSLKVGLSRRSRTPNYHCDLT